MSLSRRTNVPGYQTIVYPKLYRGIDLAISGAGKSLKYEFRVAPGADYRTIKLSYAGTNGLSIDATGRLHISTELGDVIDDAPVVYQMINGRKASADGPIKTFPLRGIKESPPYLHDGRLLTLEDTVEFFNLVLETKLTATEKADLVAFMRAL